MNTGEWYIDRNHDGRIIGIAVRGERGHDLDMACTFQDDVAAEKFAPLIVAAVNGLPALIAAAKAADDAFDLACDNASNPDAMERWIAAKDAAQQQLRAALADTDGEKP